MKVAITGHTSGIGAAIARRCQGNFKGFSRSNGYDIAVPEHRARIIAESNDCGVFVNNASCVFAQVNMLYEIHTAWIDLPRLIINISSTASDGIKNHSHPYAVYKAALDKASQQLSNLHRPVKVCNLRFGYVDTPRVASVSAKKIDVEHACDMIFTVINAPTNLQISEITILPF
jgi:NAD(P)-dependent dehydrogenase (short-subunit alcohol dehydrogenase family)